MASSNLLAVTTITPKGLVNGQAPTTGAAAYTAPSPGWAKIAQGTVCNVGSVLAHLTLSIVPSGGSFDATHRLLNTYEVDPGDPLVLTDYLQGLRLGAGDAIWWLSDVSATLDVIITGLEGN